MRPSSSGCVCVCTNQPGRTRAPSFALPVWRTGSIVVVVDGSVLDVGVGAAGGQQPQEVRLARAVAAEDRDPLAVPDLEVERLHQPGQLQVGAHHRALAGAAALEPHRDLLLARLLGGRPGLLELAEPGLRGLVLRGHAVVVLRLDLQPEHERLDLGVLLVPAAAQLLEAGEAVAPRLVVRREPAGMRPGAVAATERAQLDGDDPGRGVVEQLAVVADEQDRLVGVADPLLEPDLAGHVEEVVGLVEEQDLVGTLEEVLQHEPLLLAAAEGRQGAVLGAVVGQAEAAHRADVPDDLEVVAAGVGVLRQRLGVAELGLLVVGLHQRELPPLDVGRGRDGPARARPRAGGRRPSGRRRGRCRPSGASPRARRCA